MGDLNTINAQIKQATIVATLNKINELMGVVNTICATNTVNRQPNIVASINKLDEMIGLFTSVNGQIKQNTFVATLNKINELMGVVANLFPTNAPNKQANIVDSLNKLDEMLGNYQQIDGQIRRTTVKDTFNQVNTFLGTIASLTTATKDNLVNAINELDRELGDLNTINAGITGAAIVDKINNFYTQYTNNNTALNTKIDTKANETDFQALKTDYETFKANFAVNPDTNTIIWTEDQYNAAQKDDSKFYIIKTN